jgi:hypothetical protein
MTTGYAAAEYNITASAKLSYGNFGEEHKAGSATKVTTSTEAGGVAAVTGTMPSTQQSTAGATASAAGVITAGTATAMVTTTTASTDAEKLAALNAVVAAEAALGNATTELAKHDATVALADAKANLAVINDAAAVTPAGAGYSYGSEFDVVVSGSGEAGGIAYSASMTIDEDAASNSTGTVSMSSSGFTLAYGQDDFGDLVADNGNGLEEAAGDIKLSYAANGLSASYEMSDTGNDAYYMRAGYTGAGLTVGIESADTDGSAAANSAVNTVSVGYTMGAMTVSYDSDDKATTATNPVGNHYDAKITYTMGDTVLSAGTDEVESHYVGLTTSVAGLSLTMRSEQDSKKKADGTLYASSENEVSLSYTMGALTVAYAKDTGDTGLFGDEAETLTTVTYDLGGVTLVAKGNDQDETEVSAAFSF